MLQKGNQEHCSDVLSENAITTTSGLPPGDGHGLGFSAPDIVLRWGTCSSLSVSIYISYSGCICLQLKIKEVTYVLTASGDTGTLGLKTAFSFETLVLSNVYFT